MKTYNTLTEAVNDLTLQGFTEDFQANKNSLKATYNKMEYAPEDVIILNRFHFEGDTSPDNSVDLYLLEASDGTKGTMVVSYAAEMDQNSEVIRKLKFKS